MAVASILVPFRLGFGFGWLCAPVLAKGIVPLCYTLFCGVAVCITAVPILGRMLREFGSNHLPVGVIAIAAAAINDVIGWVLPAGVAAYATGQFGLGLIAAKLAGLAALGLVLWLVLRPLMRTVLQHVPLREPPLHPTLMACVCSRIFALGLCTQAVGISTICGGFAAGLLMHRQDAFVSAWRDQVGHFVLVFFRPIVFTFIG